jgi:hypothetical protein
MADHNLLADAWVSSEIKKDGDKRNDATHCIISSREHLMYLMFFTSQLISVAKGIRFFLGVITLLLVLVLLGVIAAPK